MPPKPAKLVCPDCDCPARWRDGVRCCPDCGDELIIDATTFHSDPIEAKGQWLYAQGKGQDRGGVRWR
jgi:hypothetical protein